MLTLAESVKLYSNPVASGVVEVFARENPILEAMPFMNIAGNAYKYNVEDSLPGIAFRDFNESYSESTGAVNPQTENLTIIGGDSDYDRALIAMQAGGDDARAVHDAMKAKALTRKWLSTFFDGDSGSNPKEFDGLKVRLTGDQVVEAGSDGADLDLDMLDQLVDAVVGEPTMLVMNKNARRKVRSLARNTTALSVTRDFFGREVDAYAGVPIRVVEDDANGDPLIPNTETMGSNTSTTSIYCLNFGPDSFHGIQTAPMDVRDLGEIESKPAYRTRIEWYSGLVLKHPRAAARLKGVNA